MCESAKHRKNLSFPSRPHYPSAVRTLSILFFELFVWRLPERTPSRCTSWSPRHVLFSLPGTCRIFVSTVFVGLIPSSLFLLGSVQIYISRPTVFRHGRGRRNVLIPDFHRSRDAHDMVEQVVSLVFNQLRSIVVCALSTHPISEVFWAPYRASLRVAFHRLFKGHTNGRQNFLPLLQVERFKREPYYTVLDRRHDGPIFRCQMLFPGHRIMPCITFPRRQSGRKVAAA